MFGIKGKMTIFEEEKMYGCEVVAVARDGADGDFEIVNIRIV